MVLSGYGDIVRATLLKMPQYHKRVIIDESIIMPDHVHLLIELENWDYDKSNQTIDE